MSCPNAHPTRGNGHCGGAGVLEHRSQWVPCPSCWAAAGRPAISHRQRTKLRLYHVLLIEVAATGMDRPDRLVEASRNLDAVSRDLDRLQVAPDVRRAWVAWVEDHAGGDAIGRLRAQLLATAE
jgi:hypothetical protein